MLNLRKQLGSKGEFTSWLTSMYLFYLINRLVDFDEGCRWLPEIHARTRRYSSSPDLLAPVE